MRFDIDRLQAFYGSSLGRMAHEMVDKRVGALWPSLNGLDVLGIGHADGLLDRYRAGARRVLSAAPGEQGAERWSRTSVCRSPMPCSIASSSAMRLRRRTARPGCCGRSGGSPRRKLAS